MSLHAIRCKIRLWMLHHSFCIMQFDRLDARIKRYWLAKDFLDAPQNGWGRLCNWEFVGGFKVGYENVGKRAILQTKIPLQGLLLIILIAHAFLSVFPCDLLIYFKLNLANQPLILLELLFLGSPFFWDVIHVHELTQNLGLHIASSIPG